MFLGKHNGKKMICFIGQEYIVLPEGKTGDWIWEMSKPLHVTPVFSGGPQFYVVEDGYVDFNKTYDYLQKKYYLNGKETE